MLKITKITENEDVYDITVKDNNNFYANGILVHNCEVLQPTIPLNHIDDTEAEIGVCTLAAVNTLEVAWDEYVPVCDIAVRTLDSLISYQDYVVKAAGKFCKERRSLGVGITNLAALLAKHKLSYEDPEALNLVDKVGEYLQYGLVKASCELAKEFGPCENYKNIYFNGSLSIDTANKEAGKLVTRQTELDWESLRKDLKTHGIRNSTLSCQMPCESSSLIQNNTNGIEPVRDLLSHKESKKGILKVLVPNIEKYGKYYTKAFDIKDNKHLTNISAVLQRWMDMGLSTNHYYNYVHYEGGNVPLSKITMDLIYAWKMGIKTLYYSNTPDGSAEASVCDLNGGGCSA